MPGFALALMPLALLAPAHQSGSLWGYHFNQGIAVYSTGEVTSPTGTSLMLTCLPTGQARIEARIKGRAPAAGSPLRLTASSRAGSRESRFGTDAKGAVELKAGDAGFVRLWARLRADDIVTLGFADGSTAVVSLAGAQQTLPAKPCG